MATQSTPAHEHVARRWFIIALLVVYGFAMLVAGWILAFMYVRVFYLGY